MHKVIISDFSRVLLFPKDHNYLGSLNSLYKEVGVETDDFTAHFLLNTNLLEEFSAIPVTKYVFTTGSVQNAPEIAPRIAEVFKDVYTVPQIGHPKTDPQAYKIVCDKIGVQPKQAFFLDDSTANIQAAHNAGLVAEQFETNQQVLDTIRNWLQTE